MKDWPQQPEEFAPDEPNGDGAGGPALVPTSGREGDAHLETACDDALSLLLAEWSPPLSAARPTESLKFRLINSFRLHTCGEEGSMNQCPKCRREFAPQFRFCPVDGLPLAPELYVHEPELLPEIEPEFEGLIVDDDELSAYAGAGGSNGRGATNGHARKYKTARSHGPVVSPRAGEYRLTFLEDAGLFARLSAELGEVTHESQLTWPELKRDPRGFVRRGMVAYGRALRRFFAQPNMAYGTMAGLAFVLTIFVAAAVVGRFGTSDDELAADRVSEDYVLKQWVTPVPEAERPKEGAAGIGGKDDGGGSGQTKEKPGGGGGGGNREPKPHSHGKLPTATLLPTINAPDPKPPTIKNPSLLVPETIRVDPLLAQSDPRPLPVGDPKSSATELSSGPGEGGGMGDLRGAGIGPGDGDGYGRGNEFNTGGEDRRIGCCGPGGNRAGNGVENRPLKTSEVTRRAQILAKPEPQYTEAARKNSVTGEVTLRVVLSSSGQVTGITPIKRLPDGLTEKAIAAARQIRFTPAEKDGQPVSQYATIVYNFNIY
ncbi:MAG: energy transducer TonB [Pyrinomonadaceae bacterium]